MATYSEQMLNLARRFSEATGRASFTAKEVARWAIDNKLWQPPDTLALSKCASDLSDALREETISVAQGTKLRRNYVVRLKDDDGNQIALWSDLEHAPLAHMTTAFHQRRRLIFGDCKKTKTDLDGYNQYYNKGEPILMSFDFTNDLLEAELAETSDEISSSEPVQPAGQSPNDDQKLTA